MTRDQRGSQTWLEEDVGPGEAAGAVLEVRKNVLKNVEFR